jgi:hypothetical protein
MAWALLTVLLFGAWVGGWSVNTYHTATLARQEKQIAAAEEKIRQQDADAELAAANAINDMQAAFEAGESKAKVIYRTIEKQGAAYVASNPVFSNPQCVIPADGVQLLAGARAGIPVASPAGVGAPTLPGTGTAPAARDVNGGTVPPNDPRPGAVERVPAVENGAGGAGALPGKSTGRARPKPRAVP